MTKYDGLFLAGVVMVGIGVWFNPAAGLVAMGGGAMVGAVLLRYYERTNGRRPK